MLQVMNQFAVYDGFTLAMHGCCLHCSFLKEFSQRLILYRVGASSSQGVPGRLL